jgi:hypothetical protein
MSFMVEIDNKKQNYLRSRFPEVPCVFNDMSEMGKSKAATWDGSSQSVPKVGLCWAPVLSQPVSSSFHLSTGVFTDGEITQCSS